MSSTVVPGTSTIAAVKIFSPLYDRVLSWSRHPHADRSLGVVSFTESSFFSVLGGLFGYLIGHWAIDAVLPWLQKVGYMGHFETAQQWFKDYGFWAIFAAGFTPIPYMVFSVAAGAASMALAPFILGSVIGRGARFFLVAALVRFGGAPIEAQIRRYIDTIGWTVLTALLILLIIWRL
jgi:membrane protein YqaA with SNARE-associated domain